MKESTKEKVKAWATALLVVLTIQLIFFCIIKEDERYKSKLGKVYLINHEQLMVVDYSILGGTFTLSNGIKVDSRIIN